MRNYFLLIILLLSGTSIFCQGPIQGPTCAMPNAQGANQYGCPGISPGTSRQWCITGGTIMSPAPQGTCNTSTSVSAVYVHWNTNVTSGVVSVNISGYGTITLNVNVSGNYVGGTVSPASQTINYNSTATTINCTAATGGVCPGGTYTYIWQQSPNNVNWTNISGATSLNYSPGILTSTTYFRRMVTASSFSEVNYSTVATVFVNPQLLGGTITSPVSTTIPYNTSPGQITGTTATGGGCSGSYSYEWYSSTDNITFAPISSSNSQHYTPPALTASRYYKRKVTCGVETNYSNTVSIAVAPQTPTPLVPGTISGNTASVLQGSGPGQLSGTIATQGSCGIYNYQWQSSVDGINYYDIAGATAQNYTPTNLQTTSYFRRKVSCSAETGYSNILTIPVHTPTDFGQVLPATIIFVSGTDPGSFTANATVGGYCSSAYSYQWESSTDNITYNTISGATAQNYDPGTISPKTYFRRATKCNGTIIGYSTIAVVSFGPATTTNFNYTKTKSVTIAGILTITAVNALTNPAEIDEVTNYMDDLGRVNQQVQKKRTPLGKDLVIMQSYDAQGNRPNKYLPYPATSSDGGFKGDAAIAQAGYYLSTTGDNIGYAPTRYETTPMYRVIEQGAPGMNGQIKTTPAEGKTLKTTYRSNLANEIRYWDFNETTSAATGATYYPVNQLSAVETSDQDGHKSIEFKNRAGITVCTKAQKISGDENSYLFTYYVYDNYALLRYVIPPNAVNGLAAVSYSFTYNDAFCIKWLFANKYDIQFRPTEKMTPGGKIVYLVYNKKDQLVLMQDPVQRPGNKWLFTKYDMFDRVIMTGQYTHGSAATQAQMQTAVDNYYTTNVNALTYETRSNSDYVNMQGYTNQSFPIMPSPITTANRPNVVNYFDDYDFDFNGTPNELAKGEPLYVSMGANYPSDPSSARKKATGCRYIVLNTTTWLTSAVFYDVEGRSIQIQKENYSTTVIVAAGKGRNAEVMSTQFDFSGKILRTETRHCNILADNTYNSAHKKRLVYDNEGRVTEEYFQYGSGAEKKLSSCTYNEIGQPMTKKLSPDFNSGSGIETLNYLYDISGRNISINKDLLLSSSNTPPNWFGMEIAYDQKKSVISNASYAKPLYNGNISGSIWKTRGAGVNRRFEYEYDQLNRFSAATFAQQFAAGWGNADPANANLNINFSTSGTGSGNRYIDYDDNGNLVSLWQKGLKLNNSPEIDKLTYNYGTGGNVLASVTDAQNDPTTTLGDFHDGINGGADYTYNANGNIITDQNKGITAITYNYLDLPETITFTGNKTIQYIYDAQGTKLQKIITDNAVPITSTYKYFGGSTYKDNQLQSLHHEEGMLRWTTPPAAGGVGGAFVFDYFIRDNQKSVRMVLTEEVELIPYPIASMENVTDKNNLSDPLNYIPYYNDVDYTLNASLRTLISGLSGYPTQPTSNLYVAKVNGGTNKIGPSTMLKVMAGDLVSISATSWYKTINTPTSGPNPFVDALIAGVAGSIGEFGKVNPTLLQSSNVLNPGLVDFLGDQANNPSIPKAYLNWILLDEQFQYVASSSGADQVGTSGNIKPHDFLVDIHRNGYLYVYTSNESNNIDVYFDDLRAIHTKGPLLEENHFYPLGLQMDGISSKAFKGITVLNRHSYQGQELESTFGLEQYEFDARLYDAQTGRWQVPDPKNQYMSPYLAMGNTWPNGTDPDGRFFLGTVFTAITDFLRTGFTKGGFEFWNWGDSHFRSAWRDYDPTRRGSRTNNAFRIDMGIFQTDPNRTFMGQFLQGVSRFGWEAPQQLVGNLYSHARNVQGAIDDVSYYGGVTLVNRNEVGEGPSGLTLGSYINSINVVADPYTDALFRHEFGHTLQSRLLGPFYLTKVAILSGIGAFLDYRLGINDHDAEWYETNANRKAIKYFEKFEPSSLHTIDGGVDWDYNEYPTRYRPNWYWILQVIF